MAFIVETVTFDTPTTTGNLVVSLSKFTSGDAPKVCFLSSSNTTAYDNGTGANLTFGAATSDGGQICCVQGTAHNVINNETNTNAYQDSSHALRLARHTGPVTLTTDVLATITTWSHTGLTFNFTTVAGTARKVTLQVIGGSDVQAAAPSFQTQNGSAGSKSRTGMSFQPNCLVAVNGSIAASGQQPHSWFGFVDADLDHFYNTGLSNSYQGLSRRQGTDAYLVQAWQGSNYAKAWLTSYNSDGYTWTENPSYNGVRAMVVPLRINPAVGKADLKITSYSSTDIQTVTTAGYTALGLLATSYGAAASATQLTDRYAVAIGMTDFNNKGTHSICVQGTGPSASSAGYSATTSGFLTTQSSFNVVNHLLVASGAPYHGGFNVYPSIAGGVEVGMLCWLWKTYGSDDTSAVSLTDAAAMAVALTGSDSPTLSASLAALRVVALTADDSPTLTLAEVLGTIGVTLTRTDDPAASVSETAGFNVLNFVSDTLALSAAEAYELLNSRLLTDILALSVSQYRLLVVMRSLVDAPTPGVNDLASLIAYVSRTDNPTASAADLSTLLAHSPSSAAPTVSAADAVSGLLVTSSPVDTAAVGLTDHRALLCLAAASDTGTASTSDAAAILAALARIDSPTLSASDTAALAALLSRSDSTAAGLTASATLAATSTAHDAASVSVADVRQLLCLATASDSHALSASPSATVRATLARSDSPTCGASDASSLVGLVSRTDAAALASTESTALAVSLTRSDAAALSIATAHVSAIAAGHTDSAAAGLTESRALAAFVARTDAPAVSVSDASALVKADHVTGYAVQLGRAHLHLSV